MIIVKIQGGLGNQLFQYATAFALAKKRKVNLYLDISFYTDRPNHYQKTNPRKFELNNFNISSKVLSRSQHFLFKFLKKTNLFYKEIIDPDIYSPSLFPEKRNLFLTGYWHNQKYFKSFYSQLIKEFEFISKPDIPNEELIKYIKEENSISIHIRRGDYANLDNILPINYYHNAIDYIKKKVKNPKFIYFSDEPNWVKENLTINNSDIIVDFNDSSEGYNDMRLMSLCKHNIIANSTLSWWGAWINQNPDKIVIAPKSYDNKTNDFCPIDWIKI